MDYGTTNKWPKKYTNQAIKTPEPTALTVAIKTYKLLFKKKEYETNVEYADEAQVNS